MDQMEELVKMLTNVPFSTIHYTSSRSLGIYMSLSSADLYFTFRQMLQQKVCHSNRRSPLHFKWVSYTSPFVLKFKKQLLQADVEFLREVVKVCLHFPQIWSYLPSKGGNIPLSPLSSRMSLDATMPLESQLIFQEENRLAKMIPMKIQQQNRIRVTRWKLNFSKEFKLMAPLTPPIFSPLTAADSRPS